jgi:hypothetical protein
MKVFHSKTLATPFLRKETPKFPEDYTKVAEVETSNLDEAYELTNNINSSWVINTKVKTELQAARSTSYGDVIEDNEGKFWFCEMMGWKELKNVDKWHLKK